MPQSFPVQDISRVDPQSSFVIYVLDLHGSMLPKASVECCKPLIGIAAELDYLTTLQVNVYSHGSVGDRNC